VDIKPRQVAVPCSQFGQVHRGARSVYVVQTLLLWIDRLNASKRNLHVLLELYAILLYGLVLEKTNRFVISLSATKVDKGTIVSRHQTK
jgi:hypothetical protein